MLERQVMVTGKAERLSTLEVVKYFHSRPRDSQIGPGYQNSPAVSLPAVCWKVNSLS
jgi:pyridoxine/pyridoxamine 5'-phosphate oxidase